MESFTFILQMFLGISSKSFWGNKMFTPETPVFSL